MIDRINNFFNVIQQTPIELYSEFGLQHELAIFLRSNYPDLTVRLEYPTPRIFNPLPQFVKKEIDIYVTTLTSQKFVIELKMPKDNGGIPKAMHNAIEDVKFLEQLRHNNIDGCYAILITECQAFWLARQSNAGIYQFFNGEQVNIQSVNEGHLPKFLHKMEPIDLNKVYKGKWNNYTDVHNKNWKYYVLEV
jgi:hypothetical protein